MRYSNSGMLAVDLKNSGWVLHSSHCWVVAAEDFDQDTHSWNSIDMVVAQQLLDEILVALAVAVLHESQQVEILGALVVPLEERHESRLDL